MHKILLIPRIVSKWFHESQYIVEGKRFGDVVVVKKTLKNN